jgi:hypothetical protein
MIKTQQKMKTVILSMLTSFLFLVSSCIPEDVGPQMRKDAEAKVRGPWKVDKTIDQVYDPISTLHSTTEYVGNTGDHYIFNANNILSIATQQVGEVERNYEVINPYQVLIGGEVWRIDALTDTQLLLIKDLNKVDENKRYVTRVYLKRL